MKDDARAPRVTKAHGRVPAMYSQKGQGSSFGMMRGIGDHTIVFLRVVRPLANSGRIVRRYYNFGN
jgi:hypothetical protein